MQAKTRIKKRRRRRRRKNKKQTSSRINSSSSLDNQRSIKLAEKPTPRRSKRNKKKKEKKEDISLSKSAKVWGTFYSEKVEQPVVHYEGGNTFSTEGKKFVFEKAKKTKAVSLIKKHDPFDWDSNTGPAKRKKKEETSVRNQKYGYGQKKARRNRW